MSEEQIELNKKVGTLEAEKLQPKDVTVTGMRFDEKTKKNSDKIIGKLVVVICKHPDKEEPLELTQVKIIKGNNVKVTGLWYNLDKEKNIVKDSSLATLMKFKEVETLNDLIGKTISTDTQNELNTYLCIRSY